MMGDISISFANIVFFILAIVKIIYLINFTLFFIKSFTSASMLNTVNLSFQNNIAKSVTTQLATLLATFFVDIS